MQSSLPSRSGCRGAGQRSWPGGGPGAEGPPWRGVHSRAPPRPAPRGCCADERESPQRGGDSRAGSRSSMAVQRFPQSPPRVSRRACGARAGRGTPRTRTRGRTARSPGARTAGSPFAPSPSQGDDPRSPPRTAPLSSGAVTPRAGSQFDAVSTFGRKAAGPWHAVFLTLAPAGFTTLAPCRLHSALGLAPTLLSQQAAWLPAPVDPFPLTAQVPGSSLSFLTCHLLVLHFLC